MVKRTCALSGKTNEIVVVALNGLGNAERVKDDGTGTIVEGALIAAEQSKMVNA